MRSGDAAWRSRWRRARPGHDREYSGLAAAWDGQVSVFGDATDFKVLAGGVPVRADLDQGEAAVVNAGAVVRVQTGKPLVDVTDIHHRGDCFQSRWGSEPRPGQQGSVRPAAEGREGGAGRRDETARSADRAGVSLPRELFPGPWPW